MQVEVYINGEQVDTDSGTKIAETRQINDFFEIRDRQTSYTNTFKLPKTERNIMLFGGMGIVTSTSIAPYKIHSVDIFREGIQTISQGIGYFKATTESFNLYCYNDNINLFDRLGDKTIADLDLTYLNHDLNIETWISSFKRSDYTYALADYGKLDNNTVEINYQAPSLFVKFLWDKIFNSNGFKYQYVGRTGRIDFNPFETEEWKELAITIDEGLPTDLEDIDPVEKLEVFKQKTSDYKAQTVNYFGIPIVVQSLPGKITEYVRFGTTFDPDGMHLSNNGSQYNRSRIRIKDSGFYKIKMNGIFNNLQTENVGMYIEKDGVNLFTVKDDFPLEQSNFSIDQKLYLRAGDEFFVKVVSGPSENRSYYSYDINLQLFLDNSVTAINFSSYLSKIKQKDFIKDVCNFFGLIFRRNGESYEFISFEELLDPLAIGPLDDFEDWSDKLDSVLEENTNLGGYAKNNRFTYRYDDIGETYADGLIKVDDQTLDAETSLVNRLYKAPDNSTVSINNLRLNLCRLYEKNLDDDGTVKNVKPKKGDPYFFRVSRQEMSVKYKVNGASGSNTYNGTVPLMTFGGLDWNNVLPNRYAAFGNMINYGKKYTVNLNLNVLDIHNMDFFKLKYIKQLGRLFYVNKIQSFTGEGLTKTEIIQLRPVEKRGAFSDDFGNDFDN